MRTDDRGHGTPAPRPPQIDDLLVDVHSRLIIVRLTGQVNGLAETATISGIGASRNRHVQYKKQKPRVITPGPLALHQRYFGHGLSLLSSRHESTMSSLLCEWAPRRAADSNRSG